MNHSVSLYCLKQLLGSKVTFSIAFNLKMQSCLRKLFSGFKEQLAGVASCFCHSFMEAGLGNLRLTENT